MTTTMKGSLGVRACPFCHDTDAELTISLADVQTIRCSSCDEEFTAQQAVDVLTAEADRFRAIGLWLSLAPIEK